MKLSSLRDNYERMSNNSYDMEFMMSVATGRYPRMKPLPIIGNKPLQNIADGVRTIWDANTTLTRLSSAQEIFLSSSNAADIGVTVGCTIVTSDFSHVNSVIVLNGQNPVSTGVTGLIVQSLVVFGTVQPLGDIYAHPSTPLLLGVPIDATKIQSKIIAGNNITHNGYFMVPKDYNAIVMNSRGGTDSVNKAARFDNFITPVGGLPLKTVSYSSNIASVEFQFLPPIAVNEFFGQSNPGFPPGTFIELKGEVSANATFMFFGFDVILAREEMFVNI